VKRSAFFVFLYAVIFCSFTGALYVGSVGRVEQMKISLNNLASNTMGLRTFTLIRRFLRLYGQKDLSISGLRDELNLGAALNATLKSRYERSFLAEAGLVVISYLDLISGQDKARNYKLSTLEQKLEVGYLLELRRDYENAAASYSDMIVAKSGADDVLVDYLLLHRGFCRALSEKKEAAILDFEEVIRSSRSEDFVEVAQTIKNIISDGIKKYAEIEKMEMSELKGQKFFEIASYRKAIEIFESSLGGKLSSRGLFYLGRAHEELGADDKSAKIYEKIIAQDKTSPWATQSNRRLFAIASIYEGNAERATVSEKNAQALGDRELTQITPVLKEITSAGNQNLREYREVVKEVQAEARKNKPAPAVTSVTPPEVTNVVAKKTQVLPDKPPVAKVVRTVKAAPVPAAVTPDNTTAAASPDIAAPPAIPPVAAKAKPLKAQKQDIVDQYAQMSRKERKKTIFGSGKVNRITLQDGNIIIGKIMQKTDTEIRILTVVGVFSVKTSGIEKQEEIATSELSN
jgi:tetratricopeptide (TPR) repeat protein